MKKQRNPRGMITTRNIGVAITMTMIVETTVNTVLINILMFHGIVSSMVQISLEKRFKMRPSGVVSKNDIGERRILDIMELWSFLEARIPPRARDRAAMSTKMAWDMPRAAYTPKNMPLQNREKIGEFHLIFHQSVLLYIMYAIIRIYK